ncbi:hypothetical protein JCM16161A_00780 [Vulcanisaeta sp. JCM 16161]|uniref:hypothetical protein n=1 Tax=Vulcanisaeta sp. JCM 16161 TaxID=1295372 RepID=UPI0006CF9556|nr:hypothetical protein [Vulcanisaeta sp. JCM 16161]
MLVDLSWNYVGRLHNDFLSNLKSINTLTLLLNGQRVRLRIALSTLDLILNFLGSANPNFMPYGKEYVVITRDTMESLTKDYDINKYVTIESMRGRYGRTYIIAIRANSSLVIKLSY